MTYKIEDGGPAFPHTETGDCGLRPGISMRDYFAAKAMQAHIVGHSEFADTNKRTIAECAYDMADAMLEARK